MRPVITTPTSAQMKMPIAADEPIVRRANTLLRDEVEADQREHAGDDHAAVERAHDLRAAHAADADEETPTIEATIEIAPRISGKVVAPGNVVPRSRWPSSIAATVVTP